MKLLLWQTNQCCAIIATGAAALQSAAPMQQRPALALFVTASNLLSENATDYFQLHQTGREGLDPAHQSHCSLSHTQCT